MAWEDVDILGDVGSRLKHVLNTKPVVHRLSNLLSPSPSLSPKDTSGRIEEYFDVEGDRKEFGMAKRSLPSGKVGLRFCASDDEVKHDEAPATTLLLLPSTSSSNMMLDEEFILFPSYDTTSSSSSTTTSLLSPTETVSCTLIPETKPEETRSSKTFSSRNLKIQSDSFISMASNTVDDTYLQHPPTMHVDYLSHVWTEEEVSASWRHSRSKRNADGNVKNSTRLENASWRVWARTRLNLGTLPAHQINWIKDDDVTWLYGPFLSSETESLNSVSSEHPTPASPESSKPDFDPKACSDTANTPRAMSLDMNVPRDPIFVRSLNLPPILPPTGILKIPTLEEVLRSRSVLELAPNRHLAPLSLESSRLSANPDETSAHSLFKHDGPAYLADDDRPLFNSNPKRSSRTTSTKTAGVKFNFQVEKATPTATYTDPYSDDERLTIRHAPLLGRKKLQRRRESQAVTSPFLSDFDERLPIRHALPSGEGKAWRSSMPKVSLQSPHHSPRSSHTFGKSPAHFSPYPSLLEKSQGPPSRQQEREADRKRRTQDEIENEYAQDDTANCQSMLSYCTVMKSGVSTTLPQIEILTDDDLFELEMFGAPQVRRVESPTSYSEDDDPVMRSNTSSPSISEYLGSSSDDLTDMELSSSAFETADFGEASEEFLDLVVEKNASCSTPSRFTDEEERMPVTSTGYFSQYNSTSYHSSYTSTVKDRVVSATSCSTEARSCGTGSFGVHIPQMESPMAMDDEEYWWMNV